MHKALAVPLASLASSRLRLRRVAACLAALAMLAGPVQGAAQSPESALKAAFLYKFANFVEWPAGTFKRDDALLIGVMGDEGVAGELEQLVAGRSFEGRPIAVRRLREGDDASGLHVLLVGAGRDARLREVV